MPGTNKRDRITNSAQTIPLQVRRRTMRFPYQRYPIQGSLPGTTIWIDRPTIPIRFVGPGGSFVAFGLVDIGSDETILPERYLGTPGLSIPPGDHANVIGMGGNTMPIRFGFYAGHRVILGHAGFLDHFTATFNGLKSHLTLTPNQTAPRPTLE